MLVNFQCIVEKETLMKLKFMTMPLFSMMRVTMEDQQLQIIKMHFPTNDTMINLIHYISNSIINHLLLRPPLLPSLQPHEASLQCCLLPLARKESKVYFSAFSKAGQGIQGFELRGKAKLTY